MRWGILLAILILLLTPVSLIAQEDAPPHMRGRYIATIEEELPNGECTSADSRIVAGEIVLLLDANRHKVAVDLLDPGRIVGSKCHFEFDLMNIPYSPSYIIQLGDPYIARTSPMSYEFFADGHWNVAVELDPSTAPSTLSPTTVSKPAVTSLPGENGYQAHSSDIVGPGVGMLRIDGKPDEYGLVWEIREPRRGFDAWTVLVYNATDEPISSIRATLEKQMEGRWYLANMEANDLLILPPTIMPGEFGFARMGNVMANPEPWEKARIVVESVGEPSEHEVISLDLSNVERRGTHTYAGSFSNPWSFAVTDLTLYVGCVEDGQLVDAFFHVSDLIRLPPGETERFSFSGQFRACSIGAEEIYTALAAT